MVCFEEDIEAFQNWMMNGFSPPNLRIVVPDGNITLIRIRDFLLTAWSEWNSKIITGHVACLKLYSSYKEPLNLFKSAPVFQLQYGETATLPFVQVTVSMRNVGVQDGCLLLTDHHDDDRMVRKGTIYMNQISRSHAVNSIVQDHGRDNQLPLDNILANLTDLDLGGHSIDIKQIVIACLQLQRLSLRRNKSLRVEDLQVIATTYCSNLQGLNLMEIPTTDIEFCLKTWEVLSSMKLIYLGVDASLIGIDDIPKKQLVTLFKQCTTLRALEFSNTRFCNDYDYGLVSNFPSLEHGIGSMGIQNILTTCKKLRCLFCKNSFMRLSPTSVHNNNLQQLGIAADFTDLEDNFMDALSAHGGLIHVFFYVRSVTSKGATTLIENSPDLLTFCLYAKGSHKEGYIDSLSASIEKKFTHRKLFTSGSFCLVQAHVGIHKWPHNTDLLSLWPSHQLIP